jgi:hypothetical protein
VTARYSGQTTTTISGVEVPVPAVTVYVYDSSTAALATLTADGGGALTNPFTSDTQGNFAFNVAAAGLFDLVYFVGGRQVLRQNGVPVGTGTNPLAGFVQNLINLTPLAVTNVSGLLSVPTRGALGGIAAPTIGQTVYLNEAGRQDWFEAIATNAAAVTADTTQAIYVAGIGVTWRRIMKKPGEYLATWFNWKGDGVTDDAPAYQAAIDYMAAAGGGTLILPPGHSMINGVLKDTALSNAQILWPRIQNVADTIAIRIKGAAPAPMSCDPVSGKNFTIIESNLNAAGWMFGGKSAAGFENRTCISVYMEDLIIRMPQNTAGSCLDFGYVHMHKLDNIRVDVPSASSCIQPTHAGSVGIRAPLDAVSAWSLWNNVLVAGFYRGFQIGELVVATHIHSAFCVWPLSTQLGEHASIILSALVTNSPNTLLVDGGLQLNIGLLNIEHDQTAAHGGSGPDWVEPFGYDIYDVGGAGHGVINYQFHDDATVPFAVNDAHNFILKRVRPQNQSGYGLLYPGQTTVTNASSLEEIRGVFGGFPWLQFVQPSSTLTDQIGVLAFAGVNPNTDTRNAQINVSYDGSLDAGKFVFTVWRGGNATTAFTIDSRGNVIPNALVAAANDTAAATANVPVGGFYQASGAVKVRLT